MILLNKSGCGLMIRGRVVQDGEKFEVPDKKADAYLLVVGIVAPAGGEVKKVKKEVAK